MFFAKNTTKFIKSKIFSVKFLIFAVLAFTTSLKVYAAGLVPCEGTACQFCDLLSLVQNVIQYILGIATLIVTGTVVYGGFLMMISGANPGGKAKGQKAITDALTGLVVLLLSYIIVDTIIQMLAPEGSPFRPWNSISC